MLHKTENLIMADCILRLLRLEKKLKPVEGLIKPYINYEEHGFTIELVKLGFFDAITFAVEAEGQIVVYIDDMAIHLLDDDFEQKKLFPNDQFVEAKDYIVEAILSLIKSAKIKNTPYLKYNAL